MKNWRRTKYAICYIGGLLPSQPTRAGEQTYLTLDSAIKAYDNFIAKMPHCQRINYMVCQAVFDVEYAHQMTPWR